MVSPAPCDRSDGERTGNATRPGGATIQDALPRGFRAGPRPKRFEGYRSGALTETQVRRLLELDTRFQVHALLKEHQVPLHYATADLEDDLAVHRDLGILPSR